MIDRRFSKGSFLPEELIVMPPPIAYVATIAIGEAMGT